jgi:flagellar biosynthesis chaperone FliJ
MYESYLSVLSQSGGNEWENVRKAEFYLDQLDAGAEKTLQLNSKAVKDLDEQYTETQKRLDDPYAKIAKLKKEKKTYATRLSVITGLITLFVWINGFIASLGEQEFFGPWVYDHTGAYWDFWRAILLIPDQVGTVVVGLIGGLVIIPIIAGLCVFVISKKWKKINSHIALVEKDAAELAKVAQNKLRCVVSVDETEKQLPQLREKRQRLSRFVHTLGV